MTDSLYEGPLDMKQQEKQLVTYFHQLSEEDAQAVLSFAEFLVARSLPAERKAPLLVNKIERPAEESVIAAIKRLSASYPMLDKDKLLTETSSLVTQHIMQGRAANEVIDELEQIFECHFDTYRE